MIDVEKCHDELVTSGDPFPGFDEASIKDFKLGKSEDKFIIPLYEDNELLMVKAYRPGKVPKYLFLEAEGAKTTKGRFLWGMSTIPQSDRILIVAGEKDRITAIQNGYTAVCSTTGEQSWDESWGRLFKGKEVAIVYDNDSAGNSGSSKVAQNVSRYTKSCRIIDLSPVCTGPGEDLQDFFVTYQRTPEDLDELYNQSEVYINTRSELSIDQLKVKVIIGSVYDHIVSLSGTETLTGISSGFHELDSITSGFQKSDLIVLAARPSMGKTSYMLNLAYNISLNNIPVGIFSLEMSSRQIGLKLLSLKSEIPLQFLKSNSLQDEEREELPLHVMEMQELPLFIDDESLLSLDRFKEKADMMIDEGRCKVLILDYLQLMHTGKEGRFQEIGNIMREMKAYCKESGVILILLSQVSRAVDGRNDKRPHLSDLRESGDVEQTADIVMFMHRPDYYEDIESLTNISPTQVIIKKHRNGPLGELKYEFNKEISLFKEE